MTPLGPEEALARLGEAGVAAVVRAPSPELLPPLAEALLAGGIEAIEVTTTTPQAVEAIAEVHRLLGSKVILGLGTTLDPSLLRPAVEAGARFIVSPVLDEDVVREGDALGVLTVPGCFTPSEIWRAHQMGAQLIKVFPAGPLGPGFLKDVLAPLPFLKLMPTGGVDDQTAGAWLKAGAWCVGAGSALVSKADLANQDWEAVTRKAKAHREAVLAGRG